MFLKTLHVGQKAEIDNADGGEERKGNHDAGKHPLEQATRQVVHG
jgi:hypothetical protein